MVLKAEQYPKNLALFGSLALPIARREFRMHEVLNEVYL